MSHNPQWNSFQSPSQPGMKSYPNYHGAGSGYPGQYHGSASQSPPGARYGGGAPHYASQASDSGGGGGGGAEFDIGVFSVGSFSSGGHKNGYGGVNGLPGKEGSPSHAGHGLRETGIIEKLLVSSRVLNEVGQRLLARIWVLREREVIDHAWVPLNFI